MAEISVHADRNEVLRVVIERDRILLSEQRVDFEGETSSGGWPASVSASTPLAELLPESVREGFLAGRVNALRVYCGPGQEIQASGGRLTVSGQEVELGVVCLGDLLSREQVSFLRRIGRSSKTA